MVLFIILIVIGVIIFSSYKSGQAVQEQWRQAAQRLQLGYEAGGLGGAGDIHGRFNGHHVVVNTFTKGSGNSSQTYTRYRMEYRNPIPVDMKITRQGKLQGVGKIFGMQDIEVGNPAFDDHLLVHGTMPDKVRRCLTIEVQSAIRDLAFTYAHVTITGNHVEVNKSGKDSDAAIIVNTVRRLAGFCEAMMEANSDTVASPNTLEVEDRPSAMPIVEIEPPEVPFDQFTSANPVVPEPLLVPVNADDADFHEEGMLEIEEGEPVAVAEVEFVPADEPLDETAFPEPEEPARSGPLDLEEVASELFGQSGGSLLMSNVFDERFKDRMVTGSGELLRIGKFSYDPVFTNTSGVKATILVCELAGIYSKNKVIAEVVYPPEKYDLLATRTGAALSVSGKLVGQDALMYRLYITTI